MGRHLPLQQELLALRLDHLVIFKFTIPLVLWQAEPDPVLQGLYGGFHSHGGTPKRMVHNGQSYWNR